MSEDGFRHCVAVLREHDPDRHLATLWLPAKTRPFGAALYAFATEVARIPATAHEPAPGEVRLQWWAEVVAGTRDHGGHPVASELVVQMRAHDLPAQPLVDLVEARRFDLYHDPMPGIGELEAYCGHTSSALFQLLALAAGGKVSPVLADACGHAGVTTALAGLCRSAGRLRARGRCYVPPEFLEPEGLDASTFVGEEPDRRHLAALQHVAGLALEHLAKARAALAGLQGAPIPVFLPLCLVEPVLNFVRKSSLGIYSHEADISALRRHWHFLRAAMSGRP